MSELIAFMATSAIVITLILGAYKGSYERRHGRD